MDQECEVWRDIVEDVLSLVPREKRMDILLLAVEQEKESIAEHERNPMGMFCAADLSEKFAESSYSRNYGAIQRATALVAYTFVRTITNNNSPADAAKLLFSHHGDGPGSGYLIEYLDGLPGIKVTRTNRRAGS